MFRVLYFLFSCATPQFTLLFFLVLSFLFVLWSFVRLVCAWFSFFLFGDQSYPILFKINYLSVCAILFLFFYSQNTKCKNIIYLFLFGDLVVHFHFCCRIFFCFLIFFCLHLPFST